MISAQAAPPGGTKTQRAGALGGLATPWALLVSLAGGAALYASFPPVGAWPLAVLGPALLVVALTGRSLRASLACGLAFGLALFVPLLSWLVNVAWYAWLVLALAESVVFAVLTVGQRLLLRLPWWPAAVAGWWVAAEAVRARWPFPFPWGRLAMSQAGAPDAHWIAIGGAPLLTFLIALAGAMIARPVITALRRPAGGPRRRWAAPTVAAAVTAGLVLAGGALPVDPVAGAPTAEVAAIQGNVPRARNLPQQLNDTEVTRDQATVTSRLAAQVAAGRRPAPDLVIWPENSTDLDPFEYPAIYAEVAGAVAAVDRPVLVGEVLDNPRRNVGQLWLPGRGPGPMYVKRQLVPFGEYVPFRGIISHVTSLTALQPINYTPGHAAVVFGVGKIRLGDVICYEVAFDSLVRSEVTAGANLLTVQSNDADFEIDGQLGETEQQIAMARLRAVESDRAVVYDSITGGSAIVAPDGRVITSSGTWRPAILEARLPLVSYRTLADRVGAWPAYVIIVLTVLAFAWAVRLTWNARRDRVSGT